MMAVVLPRLDGVARLHPGLLFDPHGVEHVDRPRRVRGGGGLTRLLRRLLFRCQRRTVLPAAALRVAAVPGAMSAADISTVEKISAVVRFIVDPPRVNSNPDGAVAPVWRLSRRIDWFLPDLPDPTHALSPLKRALSRSIRGCAAAHWSSRTGPGAGPRP